MLEEHNTQKKDNFYAIAAVLALLVAVIGFAVAAFTFTFTSKPNTITTGNISMKMLESKDSINIENAFPITDEQGMNLEHSDGSSGVFDFEVSTSASGSPGDITYNISIMKEEVDSGYTAFNDDQIKVYLASYTGSGALADETQVVAPTLVSNIITSGTTGQLKANIVNSHNTANQTITTKYRLKMWIDSQVNASSWNASTKLQYKLKIKVDGQASV